MTGPYIHRCVVCQRWGAFGLKDRATGAIAWYCRAHVPDEFWKYARAKHG